MSDQPPRVLDAPDSIWLNYGCLDHDDTHDEILAGGEVTWCDMAQYVSDVRYVRADLFARLQAQRDELLKFAQRFVEQYAGYQITNTKDAKHDVVGWLKDMASAAIANAAKDHE